MVDIPFKRKFPNLSSFLCQCSRDDDGTVSLSSPKFYNFLGSLSFSKIQVSNDMMFLCRQKNTTNVYNRGTETCTQLDASERHL